MEHTIEIPDIALLPGEMKIWPDRRDGVVVVELIDADGCGMGATLSTDEALTAVLQLVGALHRLRGLD
jgi:hypothetical protein